MTRLARAAQRAYPPSFRNRYGGELAALVDDLPASRKATADLFLGAARAWLRPSFTAAGGRLQASLATTWVAWCAGFLVAPAINRALLDPPMPGASAAVRTLLDIAYVLFFVGWALALLGAAPIVLRAVVPALRAHNWRAVRPLLPVLVLGLFEAVGLLLLALVRHGTTSTSGPSDGIAIVWLIGFAAFVASLGIGPAVSLERLGVDVRRLRMPAYLTVLLAVALSALTGCSVAAAMLAGDAVLVSSSAPVVGVLVVGSVACVAALISSVRGVRALAR
jgi:hypothetical protein